MTPNEKKLLTAMVKTNQLLIEGAKLVGNLTVQHGGFNKNISLFAEKFTVQTLINATLMRSIAKTKKDKTYVDGLVKGR